VLYALLKFSCFIALYKVLIAYKISAKIKLFVHDIFINTSVRVFVEC